MINNPMINNPFKISVKGKLTKEDFYGYCQVAIDQSTGEIQYGLPFNIESIGLRNNFLYKILLTYVKSIFNEDDMLLDMRIAEDKMITIGITVFENPSGINRYVLGAGYVNHPFSPLVIDVLLDEEEREMIDQYVKEAKEKLGWNNVCACAYTGESFLENPVEAFDEIIENGF